MVIALTPAQGVGRAASGTGTTHFFAFLLLVVGCAILRSAVATRLDDFTYDEAYHIAAGASYVQRGDFRINPEHPPLVKLWVGSFMTATGFHLSPFRAFNDKHDERKFAEEDVYYHNDADWVQWRSRIAMWGLNGLLLLLLGAVLRLAFNAAVALGAVLYLAIDPTVAAHLPVVMTDLPVGLLSVSALVLAGVAFRTWAWRDAAWCSVVLGLALGVKHSAPVFAIAVGIAGGVLAMLPGPERRVRRIEKVAVILIGALAMLWGTYFFRFNESRGLEETFNRPLQDKIADVHSGAYRLALGALNSAHIVPRAYVWGLADVVRAGLEGRAYSQLAFGRLFYKKAPWYFFPGVIAVKVPIGLSLLSVIGLIFCARGKLPREWRVPGGLLLAGALFFFLVLTRGSTYAGVRHAMPLLVAWGVLGGFATHGVWQSSSKWLRWFAALALAAALASAIPVLRPWEYFNELAGGSANAYLYFDDDSVDLGQQAKEMIRYYNENLRPTGEIPFVEMEISEVECLKRGLDWVGRDPKRDAERMASPVWAGTIIAQASVISPELWWDAPVLRAATPTARIGNLMIYRGRFAVPGKQAVDRYEESLNKIFANPPDYKAAEALLQQSAAADPRAFFVHISLGNVRLRLGSRDGALAAYRAALEHAPDAEMRATIRRQIQRVTTENLDQIPFLRNPAME